MKNFSVLHLISSLETGGAEKLLLDTIENSDHSSVNYVVVVMNKRVDENLKNKLLSICDSVYFLDRPPSKKRPKYLFKLFNIIKKHNIQLIHSHNEGSKYWSILCKFFYPELKLVYTVHDTNIINRLSRLKAFLHKKFIDMNIAISMATKKECLENGINSVIQIYNGINVQNFKLEKQNLNPNIFKIINISRIDHIKKGQDVLIKALKLCKDKGMVFECKFVGNNQSEYTQESYEYLKNLVAELNLNEQVEFLGTRHDVPELLANSDLFVLASRYEGLGLVVLESMAAGVPAIASNIDGPAELINDGENGFLFESENPEDLAKKIMYIYENRHVLDTIKQKALEYTKDFDIKIMCNKYLEIYNQLVRIKI